MQSDPRTWLDRMLGACLMVLLGAMALYGAVWLLQAIWPTLLVVVFVASCVGGLVALWRVRQSRW